MPGKGYLGSGSLFILSILRGESSWTGGIDLVLVYYRSTLSAECFTCSAVAFEAAVTTVWAFHYVGFFFSSLDGFNRLTVHILYTPPNLLKVIGSTCNNFWKGCLLQFFSQRTFIMNLENLIPDDYGQLENSDLALSEGRIRRLMRERMDDDQTLDGDVPHVINTVLSGMLDEIIDETLKEAEYMAKVKESHMRVALRNVEVKEDYSAQTREFVDQLRNISEQMEKTADRIEEQ